MKIASFEWTVETTGSTDIIDITDKVSSFIAKASVKGDGLVTVFTPGSTAAVTTIEYENGVVEDLKKAIERIAPRNMTYAHDERWGDNNGYAHVRAALMKPSLSIPILNGNLVLGTWQQIVLCDFDNRPRKRKIVVQVIREVRG